jgi:drug/metabolite transporter (DMT)-like permease
MQKQPARWLVVAAFAAVYLLWGGSYIGIHFAMETIPPFLMTATRFATAGAILFVWARWRGAPAPTRANWRAAFIAGTLLFLCNNGLIVWAEHHGAPTGVVAVLIATTPIWMVLMTWLKPGGKFPGWLVIAGLATGFGGIILLVNTEMGAIDLISVVAVLIAAFAWSYGSLYAKSAPLPKSATLSTGMQLLVGGMMQFLLAAVNGDFAKFDPAVVSLTSVVAILYLSLFASIIGFSAFTWLMRVSAPAKVSTYAYVNPVIAFFLGWILANETLTPRMIMAMGVIIASVVMINVANSVSLPRWRTAKVAAEAVT